MNHTSFPVHVVDDDPAVLTALSRLLRASGFEVLTYPAAREFIARAAAVRPGCLLLDVTMPGINGLELQTWMKESGHAWPVVFISGNSNIPVSVRAMKAGAVDFLTKPVDEQDLLRALQVAVERESARQAREAEAKAVRDRVATLTPRERQVLEHVVSGQLNKQIAGDLGTVEKTIKVHRARVMRKMGVDSVAALVRMAVQVGIGQSNTPTPLSATDPEPT